VTICVLLFLFNALWVKIAQRLTTEISPVFNIIAKAKDFDPKLIEKAIFRGPGKISQAILGGGDIQFEKPSDFLAVGIMHPVVLILICIWAVGRPAGAVAGELERGTMELLLSQPVPRSRLIVAHLVVEVVSIILVVGSVFAGTQTGLALVGPFVVDYSILADTPFNMLIPAEPEILAISGMPQAPALSNLAALMFAISGLTMALSAAGRSRWRVIGYAVLAVVVMFALNVLGQLWDSAQWMRPGTIFYYYQPQRIMLKQDWFVELGDVWNAGKPVLALPIVGVLLAVGVTGYAAALRIFTTRDLPAPL
jgi:ABC-2 type transport system permease protein